MVNSRTNLLPGLALALGCPPATPTTPGPPDASTTPSASADADATAPRSTPITTRAAIEAAIDRPVVIVGVAGDAKLGAVVLLDGAPIYCKGLDQWPEGVAGQDVEVTGTLSRSDATIARVDEAGAISQGTEGPTIWIAPCEFHLRTVDDAR